MAARMNQLGFTLVEMAIVLVIVGITLGGLLVSLSAQVDQRDYAQTRQSMEEIREALMGYALSRGYLPCPAISSANGAEDRIVATGICTNRVGFLPWAELGVKKTDSWNRLYRYSVTPAYSSSPPVITLSPPIARDITIQTRNGAGGLINLSNANDIPVAVISHGKNGYGGTSNEGILLTDTSVNNDDEKTNNIGDGTVLVSREFGDDISTTYGQYDDIIVWISPNTYLSKMVTVGKLP
ncbi:MAG: type II secretion system protein [Methylotenera sp.]|nr:type II secretion system protein [Methylotenera sp.]